MGASPDAAARRGAAALARLHRRSRAQDGEEAWEAATVSRHPLTTNTVEGNAFPLRVRVRAGVCRLAKDSDVLVDQILAWDNALFRRDLGPLPEALQDEVRRALLEFLDLL